MGISNKPIVLNDSQRNRRSASQRQFYAPIFVSRRISRRSNNPLFLPIKNIRPNGRTSNSRSYCAPCPTMVHAGAPVTSLQAFSCAFPSPTTSLAPISRALRLPPHSVLYCPQKSSFWRSLRFIKTYTAICYTSCLCHSTLFALQTHLLYRFRATEPSAPLHTTQ